MRSLRKLRNISLLLKRKSKLSLKYNTIRDPSKKLKMIYNSWQSNRNCSRRFSKPSKRPTPISVQGGIRIVNWSTTPVQHYVRRTQITTESFNYQVHALSLHNFDTKKETTYPKTIQSLTPKDNHKSTLTILKQKF